MGRSNDAGGRDDSTGGIRMDELEAALEGEEMVNSDLRASDLPESGDAGRLSFSAPGAATAATATQPAAGPAAQYKHDHAPVRNAHALYREKMRLGQRVAEIVTAVVGGWPFILVQTALLALWIAFNVYLALHWREKAFDPYPFILLNLVLSFQAAYTGPIVMMSQNRQNQKDRYAAEVDFECNVKAEEEIRVIMDHLVHQDTLLATQDEVLARQDKKLGRLDRSLELICERLERLQAQPPQIGR